MQYAHRWHREGCGCDDWRRWSNLRSSPLVVQPTAAFDLFVPWRQKWRDLPGSNQWNSDQHKFRKQKFVKETQTSTVFEKKSTSLSLFKNLRSQEKILSAWDLKEITLWSWSTYTPLQNHHLRVVMWAKTLRNATFQLVSPQPQRVESACVLQQRCLNLSRRGNICLGHCITCVSSLYRESI